jgi:hypothetical protein
MRGIEPCLYPAGAFPAHWDFPIDVHDSSNKDTTANPLRRTPAARLIQTRRPGRNRDRSRLTEVALGARLHCVCAHVHTRPSKFSAARCSIPRHKGIKRIFTPAIDMLASNHWPGESARSWRALDQILNDNKIEKYGHDPSRFTG